MLLSAITTAPIFNTLRQPTSSCTEDPLQTVVNIGMFSKNKNHDPWLCLSQSCVGRYRNGRNAKPESIQRVQSLNFCLLHSNATHLFKPLSAKSNKRLGSRGILATSAHIRRTWVDSNGKPRKFSRRDSIFFRYSSHKIRNGLRRENSIFRKYNEHIQRHKSYYGTKDLNRFPPQTKAFLSQRFCHILGLGME